MAQRGPDPGEEPNPELLEAVEAAARSVGGERPAGAPSAEASAHPRAEAQAPMRVRFDDERPRRAVLLAALLLLAAALGGRALLSLRTRAEPPPERVEADLRWAVAQVVRRVEELRARTGRLPTPDQLQGLVSDLVFYAPSREGYVVRAHRGDVRVEYDGSVPLERWLGSGG